MKFNFRYSLSGPLSRFVWFRHLEGYAPFRIQTMMTMSYHDRLKFIGGVGWVCDHWQGSGDWKAPGYMGRYYHDDGTPGYQPLG